MSYSPKTKSPDTLLAIIVDKSGSMSGVAPAMSKGINDLVAEQAAAPGTCEVTLTEFSNTSRVVVESVPAPDFGTYTLEPSGSTALMDAIGVTINRIDAALAGRDSRPQIIVAIVTDGYENASTTWTAATTKPLIASKTEQGWDFTYLGANQDAILVAGDLGIRKDAALTYSPVFAGATFDALSTSMLASRSTGQSVSYNSSQRAAAVGVSS